MAKIKLFPSGSHDINGCLACSVGRLSTQQLLNMHVAYTPHIIITMTVIQILHAYSHIPYMGNEVSMGKIFALSHA